MTKRLDEEQDVVTDTGAIIGNSVPVYDVDYYSDDFILNPYPHYAKMRELGPIVFIPMLKIYAITRYAEVREVLQDWAAFRSGDGIAADKGGNDFFAGASNLMNDPPVHDEIRVKMAAPLLPGALANIRDRVGQMADALIDRLVQVGQFDGMADLSRFLPETLVTELVGLPDDGRENMLTWAAAAFDITGVQNERGRRGTEVLSDMRDWIVTKATPDQLKPGSLTARIRDMVTEGEIPDHLFMGIMNDYITPSLDTTISVTGELIFQLGRNPDQWTLIKNDQTLIDNAVNEAVRTGSPIRSFTRVATRDYDLSGITIPEGARVMVMFASANYDERKYADPERFDVLRGAKDHLGFGSGIHMCVGMHLAKLEIAALLKAMIRRVDRIEVGTPTLVMNNTIRAYATLPTRFIARDVPLDIVDEDHGVSPANDSWIHARIQRRAEAATDIVSLELVDRDGKPLPPFTAGSHIDVEITPGLVRQYSLCNDPDDRSIYRLGILREPTSRGGSVAVHEQLVEGTELRISRPRNFFALDETAPASLLLAGGIGITPMIAMAHRLQAIEAPFQLHYATRSRSRAAFLREMDAAGFGDKVSAYFDDDAEHRLDVAGLLAKSAPGTHLYVCGPQGFIDHVLGAAEHAGWVKDIVHVEHFSAAPVLTGAPFEVVAKRSGRTFHIPCERTILDVLNEAGIDIPSSCRSGVCATCMTEVVDGVPDHRDMVLTDEEKASNSLIAVCCSRSRTRQLVLDV
jgi:cytochrome P450/ferredoxin-NADP reductase